MRILLFVCSLLLAAQVIAQDATDKSGRPDIPGSFQVDFGLNYARDVPDDFDINYWGSQSVNLYYQYDIRIRSGKFFVSPGLGLGLDHFKFNNRYTLSLEDNADGDILRLVPGPEGINKSQLVTNYVDVPLEIKFALLPEDLGHSFKLAIGARGGMLFDTFTKMKIKTDGDVERIKDKRDWHVNPFRYGVYARIYIGNFNFFLFDNLSPLFKPGDGPDKLAQDITTFTGGISITGF